MGFVRSLAKPPKAQTGYAGAATNRLTLDWIMSHRSVDQEIRGALIDLRTRARELVRNTPWCRRYVRLLRQNVVGPHGIRLQARMQRAGTAMGVANDAVETAWHEWGKVGTCTVDGKLSWRQLQGLAITNAAADGEVLIRIVRGFDNPFGFALQLLDPDQLDEKHNVTAANGGNEIRMGVELNPWGRPVAYHIWAGHPAEPTRRERKRIPADDIIFLGEPDRPAQTRYVPWIASVMLDLNMLRGYFEAELVAARVAASQGGFLTRDADDLGDSLDTQEDPKATLTMEMEPATFTELPAGMNAVAFTPQHPTAAFPDFVKGVLRSVATGLGVSYNALANDLEGVNYSSIRAGMLDERDSYRDTQQWLIEHFHQRVYDAWLPWAYTANRLDARVPLDRYQAVSWQPRGWAWVDPKNDVEAAILARQHHMGSRQQVLNAQGVEFEEVLDDLVAEERMIRERQLPVTPPSPNGNGRRPSEDRETEVETLLRSLKGGR
jgi:lambda family phage portal protein